jgi:chemotaxis family two-component system sensor kinase Cph1
MGLGRLPPRRVAAPELRQACVLLGQLAAWQLGFVEEAGIARRTSAVKAIEKAMLQEATAGQDYREALLRNSDTILDLLQATGLALSSGGSVTTLGETPGDEDLRDLLAWLSTQGDDLFQTDHLPAYYPPAAGWPDAAGVLAVSLGGLADNIMVWFRPELARTVTWAGTHGATEAADAHKPLTPRRSFAAWTEQVRGRSRPWAPHEIAAANGLRDMIVDIILRRSLQLEQINASRIDAPDNVPVLAKPFRKDAFNNAIGALLADVAAPSASVVKLRPERA